jgi:prepilin-type N-terminal cleavage/methylation domain-containing protein
MSRHKEANDKGFSLIELLVVVMIIAILSAVSAPALLKYRRTYQIRAASQQVVSELQTARMRAISRNAGRGVFLAVLDNKRFQWVGVPSNAVGNQDFTALSDCTANTDCGRPRELPQGITFDGAAATNATIGFNNLGALCKGQPCSTLINTPGTPYIVVDAGTGIATFNILQQGTGLRRTVVVAPGGRITSPLTNTGS